MKTVQSASAVMMVRPTSFGFNEQTARTNTFQKKVDVGLTELCQSACREFDAMATTLRKEGIQVITFEDSDKSQPKPDAVFPNNWFSTWSNGQVFLYPMETVNRRAERNVLAIEELSGKFNVSNVADLSSAEEQGTYLESTGVMIFDHQYKIVYGCISSRCDVSLFNSHALELGYMPVAFHAYAENGTALYHTNLMLGVATTTAVLCTEAITDETERAVVVDSLASTGHEIVDISYKQMASFCGNVLELQNQKGDLFLAMSRSAYGAFTPKQRKALSKDKTILSFDVSTIETVGGGSVRCMLGEVFLPRLS